jgi:hypothetical protein
VPGRLGVVGLAHGASQTSQMANAVKVHIATRRRSR